MNELEKDIDLAGILQNDRIKEEYRFLDFKGSPTDRIKKYAPLIKEEIIRMQDYSTDTEEYSAAWDKMNFLLDIFISVCSSRGLTARNTTLLSESS